MHLAATHGLSFEMQKTIRDGEPIDWDRVDTLWQQHKATGKRGDNFKLSLYGKHQN